MITLSLATGHALSPVPKKKKKEQVELWVEELLLVVEEFHGSRENILCLPK